MAEGVDTRLYNLWLLLSQTVDASTRYAIDSIAPIEPMLGAELAAALMDALIQHWRLWQPTLKSTRSANEQNQINVLDCMGIAGVSLEARSRPHWAERLSSDEAALAASYALNGKVGLVLYQLQPDGSLNGVWTVADQSGAGTEILTPAK